MSSHTFRPRSIAPPRQAGRARRRHRLSRAARGGQASVSLCLRLVVSSGALDASGFLRPRPSRRWRSGFRGFVEERAEHHRQLAVLNRRDVRPARRPVGNRHSRGSMARHYRAFHRRAWRHSSRSQRNASWMRAGAMRRLYEGLGMGEGRGDIPACSLRRARVSRRISAPLRA